VAGDGSGDSADEGSEDGDMYDLGGDEGGQVRQRRENMAMSTSAQGDGDDEEADEDDMMYDLGGEGGKIAQKYAGEDDGAPDEPDSEPVTQPHGRQQVAVNEGYAALAPSRQQLTGEASYATADVRAVRALSASGKKQPVQDDSVYDIANHAEATAVQKRVPKMGDYEYDTTTKWFDDQNPLEASNIGHKDAKLPAAEASYAVADVQAAAVFGFEEQEMMYDLGEEDIGAAPKNADGYLEVADVELKRRTSSRRANKSSPRK
jgi:hypothetical protein